MVDVDKARSLPIFRYASHHKRLEVSKHTSTTSRESSLTLWSTYTVGNVEHLLVETFHCIITSFAESKLGVDTIAVAGIALRGSCLVLLLSSQENVL